MNRVLHRRLGRNLIAITLSLQILGIACVAPMYSAHARASDVDAGPATLKTAGSAATDLVVYGDALASGWESWSWDITANFANTSPARGSNSIAVIYNVDWAGLSLHAPSAIQSSEYQTITFWARSGAGMTTALLIATEDSSNASSNSVAISVPANAWQAFTITMAALGNPASFQRLDFKDDGSAAPAVPYSVYIDDVRLLAGTPTPPPPSGGITASVRIQAGGTITPVDSRLLGTNVATWSGDRFANATLRARTAASGVSVMRMPGGSWSNGYGWYSYEMRADQAGALPCGQACSWAARPTDFIDFMQATNKQGMWVVSINGTSKEAAAAVAFFNARITDTAVIGTDIKSTNWYTAGHWAQLRAAHGNPEPVGIKLWGVGNEVYGGLPASGGAQCAAWGWEDVWTCDGTEYASGVGSGASRHEGFIEMRNAMRAVDPTIQVGAIGVPVQSDWNNWGNEVISATGQVMDFYDIHQYAYFTAPGNMTDVLAQPFSPGAWSGIKADVQAASAAYAGGRQIPIGITEHGMFSSYTNDTNLWMTRVVDEFFIADSIGQMALNRYAMANVWMVNHSHYGFLADDTWERRPYYYAYVLWSKFGSQMLPVTSTLDAASQLSVYAGRDGAGRLTLLAINKTGGLITATVDTGVTLASAIVDGTTATSLSDISVLYNGVTEAALANDLSNAPSQAVPVNGRTVTRAFAPYSMTLLRMTVVSANTTPRAFVPKIMAP
jgi:hypothetical protein